MKITKYGHCCLLIEEKGLRVLTDPGMYSTRQDDVKGIDVVLITHDHPDHLHIESLKTVLKNNPQAKIFTNKTVGKMLDKENISYDILEHGSSKNINSVLIEAFGKKHEVIYPSIPQSDNTGYFIANKFFYPGDAFTNPEKHVEVLALPVAGPWLSIKDAVDYAKLIKPKKCFPVHDGMLKSPGGTTHRIPIHILTPLGIEFVVPEENKPMEF
jgi:L-ascorbate metabolism protein UlaG (beta-lactamase superfamily)